MSQADRAKKAAARSAPGWNRNRMNETHRKGKRGAKKQVRRAQRRLDKATVKAIVDVAQSIAVMQAIIDVAEIIRHRWARETCDGCSVSYHPRDGAPPKETTAECGHAFMREMYSYWDSKIERYIG